jgi:nucleoside-diphosphate-sugar epimerase
MPKSKVLITGASGLIGGLVLENLSEKYDFSALNRRKVERIPFRQADISNLDEILPAFEGIDTVLHLSAYLADVNDWENTNIVNIKGTYNVFEAASRNNVSRVVFASSGSTMLGYELDNPYGPIARGEHEKIPSTWKLVDYKDPVRPDSLYGVSKIFGETLGRYFSDYHGMSVINIRLGAVLDTDKPKLVRHYPGYLSQSDCVQIIDLCLSAPASMKFEIFDAISDNNLKWRDTSHATNMLGWNPVGRSEQFEL